MGKLVDSLLKLFVERGGSLKLNSEVETIVTDGGVVRGLKVNRKIEPFDFVVSNADVIHTYRNLLLQEPKVAQTRKKVTGQRSSMSLFLIYIGTCKKFTQLAHNNVLFGPRFKDLMCDVFTKGHRPSRGWIDYSHFESIYIQSLRLC